MKCLSETYLDSSYVYDDQRLNLKELIVKNIWLFAP